jgi:hypothetical protein
MEVIIVCLQGGILVDGLRATESPPEKRQTDPGKPDFDMVRTDHKVNGADPIDQKNGVGVGIETAAQFIDVMQITVAEYLAPRGFVVSPGQDDPVASGRGPDRTGELIDGQQLLAKLLQGHGFRRCPKRPDHFEQLVAQGNQDQNHSRHPQADTLLKQRRLQPGP